MSKRYTHSVNSFVMPNIHAGLWPTRFFETPTVSAIWDTFIQRSTSTRSCFFVVLSCVIAVFGAPTRGSSKIDTPWNSLSRFSTVTVEGEESPYTASKCYLISLRGIPSKDNNKITDRYCFIIYHFSKICGLARFHSFIKENYKSKPAEINFDRCRLQEYSIR